MKRVMSVVSGMPPVKMKRTKKSKKYVNAEMLHVKVQYLQCKSACRCRYMYCVCSVYDSFINVSCIIIIIDMLQVFYMKQKIIVCLF